MITTIQIPSTCFKSSSSTLTQKQRPNLFVENGEIIVFHPYRSIMMMKLQTNHIQFSNFFSNKQTESKKNCKIEICLPGNVDYGDDVDWPMSKCQLFLFSL